MWTHSEKKTPCTPVVWSLDTSEDPEHPCFCLYCTTELHKIVMFISPFIFIPFNFPCRWLQVPAGSTAGLKPSPACLTAAKRQMFPTAPNVLLMSIPNVELEGSSLCPGEPGLAQNSKSRALPCKATPVKMISFFCTWTKALAHNKDTIEWDDEEPW